MSISTDNIASKITEQHRKLFSYELNYIDIGTPRDVAMLSRSGKLENMLLPLFVAMEKDRGNTTESCYLANNIREIAYAQQMDLLQENVGRDVVVHHARILSKPSQAIGPEKLKGITPFSHVRLNSCSMPFVQAYDSGICAIEDTQGKYLFVNPQLFNPSLKMPDAFQELTNGDVRLKQWYVNFLKKSFGEENINQNRPELVDKNSQYWRD